MQIANLAQFSKASHGDGTDGHTSSLAIIAAKHSKLPDLFC